MLTISGRGVVEHWIGVDNKKSRVVASEAYNAIMIRLDVPGMDDGVKLGEDMEPHLLLAASKTAKEKRAVQVSTAHVPLVHLPVDLMQSDSAKSRTSSEKEELNIDD